MTQPENLHLISRPLADLKTATADWLAARNEYKKQASDENEHAYNLSYFALGEAWAGQCPDAVDVPGGFEAFRRSLIVPETGE
jgi:hypothetical protein